MNIRYSVFLCLVLSVLLITPCQLVAETKDIGGEIELTDHNGQPFSLQSLRGKVVLLFFGYTTCPDICPAELTNLAKILNNPEIASGNNQVLFITVDPERDTPSIIKDYVQYFHPDMIGLTGTMEQIKTVTNQYNANFKHTIKNDGSYLVDHAANLYIINPEGKLSAIIPYGFPSSHVVSVIKQFQ